MSKIISKSDPNDDEDLMQGYRIEDLDKIPYNGDQKIKRIFVGGFGDVWFKDGKFIHSKCMLKSEQKKTDCKIGIMLKVNNLMWNEKLSPDEKAKKVHKIIQKVEKEAYERGIENGKEFQQKLMDNLPDGKESAKKELIEELMKWAEENSVSKQAIRVNPTGQDIIYSYDLISKLNSLWNN